MLRLDNKKDGVLTKSGKDFVIYFTPVDGQDGVLPITYNTDKVPHYWIGDDPIEFYPYKGEIRKEFSLSMGGTAQTAKENGAKVSESAMQKFIDFKSVVPKYAKYTDYYKATFEDGSQAMKVGVLTNKEDGVVDMVLFHEQIGVLYNPCNWQKADEITCSTLKITFKGEVLSEITEDGSSVSVVSCLVFFISVLVFSLL